LAAAANAEQGVFEKPYGDALESILVKAVDFHRLGFASKGYRQQGYFFRRRQGMECPISRHEHSHLMAACREGSWHITHDITYAADFAARQQIVFCCQHCYMHEIFKSLSLFQRMAAIRDRQSLQAIEPQRLNVLSNYRL